MPTLRSLLPWLAPLAPFIGLVWSLMVHATSERGRRPALLREEDMTDWLLHDIGWKDGRDMSAWRDARRASRQRF